MLKTRITIAVAVAVCAACSSEVTSPQDETAVDTWVRRDGGGTLGSGYRTPADSIGNGSSVSSAAGGGTLGSGYAVPDPGPGTLGSGY
jgi:hypothetical protein